MGGRRREEEGVRGKYPQTDHNDVLPRGTDIDEGERQ